MKYRLLKMVKINGRQLTPQRHKGAIEVSIYSSDEKLSDYQLCQILYNAMKNNGSWERIKDEYPLFDKVQQGPASVHVSVSKRV